MFFSFKRAFIILPFCLLMNEKKQENTDYILLQYSGKTDKSISRVVFYLKSFEPRELPLLYETYKVCPDDFKSIREAIINAKDVTKINTNAVGYYNYLICEQNTSVLKFASRSKYETQKMLSWILRSIQDSSVKARVEKTFTDISLRIW